MEFPVEMKQLGQSVRCGLRGGVCGAALWAALFGMPCLAAQDAPATPAAPLPVPHRLLHAAGKATGLPVLYNTSFNLFGDPLVCTPRDAVRSFYSSGIDALFAGNFFIEK